MTPENQYHQFRLIKYHYHQLQAICFCLLIVVCLQSLFLFSKRERIILHPPELTQQYWVEGNRFSPSYIEEMAKYMCHLMLDVSPDNFMYQATILLRYAHPKAYGVLKTQLTHDATRLKQQQVCLNFIPKTAAVTPHRLTAYVTGDLNRYVGTKRIDSEQTTWKVIFSQNKGRLFLQSIASADKQEIT